MTDSKPSQPRDPARQDDDWARYVKSLRTRPAPSFTDQYAHFQEIYAGRSDPDGPPLAWRPGPEQLGGSNLGRFMKQLGFLSYGELHRWSVEERQRFWARVIRRLGIVFARAPDEIMANRHDPTRPGWLAGARLNPVDSCFTAPPDRLAVVSGAEGSESLTRTTYGDLETLANRVANGLHERGLAEGDGIALYMPMNLECVASYLGIVRAGCRVISVADSFAPGELRKRMEIGEARTVITVDSFTRGGKVIRLYEKVREADVERAVVIPSAGEEVVVRRHGDLLWRELLSDADDCDSVPAGPDRVSNILFSSGTTAEPKGIPWTQLTPIKCAMDGHFHQDIQPHDVVAWPTNIGWMMGPWLIYATLINGAAMALYQGLPSGDGFARFVKRAGVTVLGTVPSLVRAWRSSNAVGQDDWPRVRVFSSTGEPSNREDYLWLMSRTGYRAPVIEYCGGTEIGGGYITGTVVQPASPATFTTPALGIDFRVLDDAGKPVQAGEAGELFIEPPSIGLSERLLNRDHHEVYYAGCPTGPGGETLRRHGDRMTLLRRGFYRAQGRADDTMNLGGIKVSPLEIEHLIEAHPSVHESAAVSVRIGGEGVDALVLFVVPVGAVSADELRRDLSAMIAQHLNPLFRIHDLVTAQSLPRTASNKLMRRQLRAEYLG